jgi:hypothetical protein
MTRNQNDVKLIMSCKKKRVITKNGEQNNLKNDRMNTENIIMKSLKNGKPTILNISQIGLERIQTPV